MILNAAISWYRNDLKRREEKEKWEAYRNLVEPIKAKWLPDLHKEEIELPLYDENDLVKPITR